MSKIEYAEGQQMGSLIFLKRYGIINKAAYGIFLCTCGVEFRTRIQAAKSGKTKSCGCLQPKIASIIKNVYIEGDKIGNCIYLNDAAYKKGESRRANFKCQCGEIFTTRIQNITEGATKSCGCLTNKLLSERGALPEKGIPAFSEKDIDRFWRKVGFTANPDKCWIWQAGGQRYGDFVINSSSYKSNRIAYYLSFNIDPKELSVMHSCDTPKCCNPAHLSLGTHWENMQDMAQKGRAKKTNNITNTLN